VNLSRRRLSWPRLSPNSLNNNPAPAVQEVRSTQTIERAIPSGAVGAGTNK
jgi:hypothetical protein